MKIVVPFKRKNAKSRLAGILTQEERDALAMNMLCDVMDALHGFEIDVLTTSMLSNSEVDLSPHILLSDSGLNEALNEYLNSRAGHDNDSVMIVMADLPLISSKHIKEIEELDADVVIAPGRGGGTNILYIRDPSGFYVDYYGASFIDHLRIARENGSSVEVYDSFAVSTDIDEPDDLVELLIHGNGRASRMLADSGFKVVVRDGRVVIDRNKM
ncbi:MAG TPA: 2-phospho-L-lactate guanylyltransferase [Methanosarcinales archaeon]|nr:2-phospho-L-lactate guanylyltransferase [Methanosarcinales archaeon]